MYWTSNAAVHLRRTERPQGARSGVRWKRHVGRLIRHGGMSLKGMPRQKASDGLRNHARISHHQEVIHPGKQDLFGVRGNRLKGPLRPVKVRTTLGPEDIKNW